MKVSNCDGCCCGVLWNDSWSAWPFNELSSAIPAFSSAISVISSPGFAGMVCLSFTSDFIHGGCFVLGEFLPSFFFQAGEHINLFKEQFIRCLWFIQVGSEFCLYGIAPQASQYGMAKHLWHRVRIVAGIWNHFPG